MPAPPRPESPPRSWRADPRVWVVVVALLFLSLELGLRAAGYGALATTYTSARYGWRMYPDVERIEEPFGAVVRTNEHGFRDAPWPAPESLVGAQRPLVVAFVGNSLIWGGAGLPLEERFDRVLAAELEQPWRAAQPPRTLLTLNLGLPGYTFEQCLRLAEDELPAFEPDLLVFALTAADLRPMRTLRDEPQYPFRRDLYELAISDAIRRHLMGGWAQRVSSEQRAAEQAFLADPFAPQHEAAWAGARERMSSLLEQQRAHGGELLLLILPSVRLLWERHSDSVVRRWQPWATAHQVAILDLADPLRLSMQPLLEELRQRDRDPRELWGPQRSDALARSLEHLDRSAFYIHDPMHLSAWGNLVLGRALAEHIDGWVATRSGSR